MKKMDKKILAVNSEQLKNLLEYFVKQNRKLQELGIKPKSLNIIGERGLGKTTVIEEFAAENGLEFVKICPASFEETGDLTGYPYKEFYMCRDVVEKTEIEINGVKVPKVSKKTDCAWIDHDFIQMYSDMGYKHNGRVRKADAMPNFIERIQGKENGILLIDDFTRAPQNFQQLLMDVFLNQETHSWKLPKGWTVIATSNPNTNDYIVEELDKAQADRFFTFEMKFDIQKWSIWADNHHIDSKHIMFLLDHPELIGKNNSARSVTSFFESILGLNYEENKGIINDIGETACGVEFMALFNSAMHNMKYDIPTPEFIMEEPSFEKVKDAIQKVVGGTEDKSYRADISWVIMNRLQKYCLSLKVTPQHCERLRHLIMNKVLNDNQAYFMAKKIMNSNKGFLALCYDIDLLTYLGR